MRVQGLNIALRPRTSWEAADLGVALVRQHARPVFGSWLLASGAAFVLLNAVLVPFGLAWLAALLLWWLKPAFDALPLHVLSRAIMDERAGMRDTLRTWPRAWRSVLPWLLWRRLNPLRALLLPVDLLEGERGPRRKVRVRALASGEGSTPLLLWLIGAHLELMLWGSAIVFGLMLVPTEFLPDSLLAWYEATLDLPPRWLELLNNLLYWGAMAVVEPFYVGAGFALYLNRRTVLEGWDIELAFRRLAARLTSAAVALALLAAGALPCDGFAAAVAANAASEVAAVPPPTTEVKTETGRETGSAPPPALFAAGDRPDAAFARALRGALAHPDLAPRQKSGGFRLRHAPTTDDDEKAPAWLGAVGAFLALVFENIGWILLVLGLVLLLANARRWWPWLVRRVERAAPVAPAPLHEIAVPLPLPDDLPAVVLSLWRAGEARAALSLFYRGALAALVQRVGTPLPPGATEADGLRHARRLGPHPFALLFRRIVAAWESIAYAHRAPSETELVELLDAWRGLEPAA